MSINQMLRLCFLGLIGLHISCLARAQDKGKPSFQIQLDSRNTFVSKESVGIFGLRGGLLVKNKYELGIGVYGSRVLGFLGKEIDKTYVDNSLAPAQSLPATIGFEYFSFYGEYILVENARWKLTANSQYGMGRVNIEITDLDGSERLKKEGKSLVEHSMKMKYQALPWLQLIGGLGYRYLLNGEQQIKKAFNAPIYVISTEIDFKLLFKNKNKVDRKARDSN